MTLLNKSSFSKSRMAALLVTAVIVLCRLVSVRFMPDVFCDEEDILDHMRSILATGCDSQGNRLPLFPIVGVGRATYAYLYPMMLFLSVIGVSATKARLVQQVLTILSCFLTAQGMKIWTGKDKTFRICLWTSLTLPWGFLQANRVWDPSFTPLYFSLYFLFFCLLMKKDTTKLRAYLYAIGAALSLVLLATVYPPVRIPAVAMWIVTFAWAWKEKKVDVRCLLTVTAVSAAAALPLAINLLDPQFNSRSVDLLIFNRDVSIFRRIYVFIRSFFSLFDPNFLFFTGDAIYRHSLHVLGFPLFGMLGTASLIPMGKALRMKKLPNLMKYMFFIILCTCFSVALTYDYQPHGLRSCLVWLPYCIILSYGWEQFFEQRSKKFKAFWYAVPALQFVAYFVCFVALQSP